MFQRSLYRHVRRNHTNHPVFDCSQCGRSFARHGNLEKHRRNCTGCAPAAERHRVAVPVPVPVQVGVLEFVLRVSCRSLGGAVKQFTLDMMTTGNLVVEGCYACFQTFNVNLSTEESLAVDPAVFTQPAVTLTSEMLAVYSFSSPR